MSKKIKIKMKLFLMTIMFTLTSALSGITFNSIKAEAAVSIKSGTEYIIYTKLCSWKCLQPKDFGVTNGTEVNLWDYWGSKVKDGNLLMLVKDTII